MKLRKMSKDELGSFYTSSTIANYVAKKLWQLSDFDATKIKILDPAVGNGNLLEPFLTLIPENLIENTELHGYDIDDFAIDEANIRFDEYNVKSEIKSTDSLLLFSDNETEKADLLVSNPPWGAKVMHSREELQTLGFETAVNQFDSYDLFIELSLKLLKHSGYAAFIIPDSIFQAQHEPIRRKLIDETTILSIYKLGEGFFEGVFRSTVLIFLKNVPPLETHNTQVTTLRKQARNQILLNQESLSDYEQLNSVKMKQKKFRENNYRFNIEITEDMDSEILDLILSNGSNVNNFFDVGRGIEISKHGKYHYCKNCDFSEKKGKKELVSCPECGADLLLKPVIFTETAPNTLKMVAGEDFSRYSIPEPRYILQRLNNLNYKTISLTKNAEKILIRKTGLGLTATLDKNKLLTNQVVFHITEDPNRRFPIKVLLAILNSRVILFYHLKHSGETEWKSHPYITQSDLKSLPLPSLEGKEEVISSLEKLIDEVYRLGYSKELDLQIEKHVMYLFSLGFKHMKHINNFVKGIDQLKVISKVVLSDEELLKLGG
ncbi:N-6 DNA methylase [Streptococcus suis]|uniref:N-6 DNA methylase n=2 Tax=Streptococcus suis TaxID=1307 RepID=UPI00209B036D|nr:N-6 DNA methylase [Streptococcus suis]MCO8188330.1 N-6 DNA methylase [Streptococcus suis]MCO8229772.1 N-6 DNA methylase [Streptococcus suis]HEM3500921.1 N-6 DNA methylase [Streptococcus suis]